MDADWSIYCGPGVWYNQTTGRIRCRLAHTKLAALGPDNYRGETDPRKLKLIVTAAPNTLYIRLAENLRIQELVLRGARRSALNIEHSQNITVDNVTCYGSDPVVNLRGCRNVRLTYCNFRGIATPWSFRSSHKYRGTAVLQFGLGRAPPEHSALGLQQHLRASRRLAGRRCARWRCLARRRKPAFRLAG